ncbi:hypothetical protein QN277_022863 [Acacia crassicarpa]|nr:hypothetical protein QN277_022863 [Acacia crassicarpa]
MAVLERCGFHTSICLRNLVDKALISIDFVVHMHDLIQSMAFEIVRQECVKNPGGRSRLQKPDEVYDVLKSNKGSDAIQGMSLDLSQIRYLQLSADALKKMTNLRFLKFYTPMHKMSCTVHLPSGLVSFSNPLRHLQLDKFSPKSQPLSFCVEKLVEIHMRGIQSRKLWDGVQNLVNLLCIDLSESEHLIELPDLSLAQNLESLHIYWCRNLCYLDPSILSLPRLKYVELEFYQFLTSLIFENESKPLLRLCLQEVSVSSHELEETSVETLDISIGCMEYSLNGLTLMNLTINETSSMGSFLTLDLYGWGEITYKSKLHTLFDYLLSLESICLKGISELIEHPNNIKHISRLKSLDVSDCKNLQSLPDLPPSIKSVIADGCISLEIVPISITSAPQLRFLFLQNCLKLKNDSLSCVMEWAYFSLKQSARTNEKSFVCYPGSKAPEWFTFSQETKASNYITIELPPSTNDLAGFIFCSVLSHVSDGYYYLQCQLYYDGKPCECIEFDLKMKNLDSHHVLLWCDSYPSAYFIKTMDDKNTNYMPSVLVEFSIVSWDDDDDGVIEACGVWPIYSSDTKSSFKKRN